MDINGDCSIGMLHSRVSLNFHNHCTTILSPNPGAKKHSTQTMIVLHMLRKVVFPTADFQGWSQFSTGLDLGSDQVGE